jgi:SAM-dependent methyltransferase
MRDWIEFYDSPHSIYVNARHADVHYRDTATQVAAFVPGPSARVLDYGCGEAIHADTVAAVAAQVFLCDAAPNVRASVAARFAANGKIRVVSPEDVERMTDRSLDLIVANSVVQYLTRDTLTALLALWRRLLAPDGVLIVADVIPPEVGVASDAFALVRYAASHGFLIAALAGLVRTAASSYRHLHRTLSKAQYGEAEFLNLLRDAGFAAGRLPRNMEHNQARMTFRARPA